jgi:hypothetical protein
MARGFGVELEQLLERRSCIQISQLVGRGGQPGRSSGRKPQTARFPRAHRHQRRPHMAQDVTIVVSASSIAQSRSGGSITGVIALSGPGWFYPEESWSDFPVVVLGWWLHACQRVGSQVGASALCRFMDGPYSFRLRSLSVEVWQVECFSGQGIIYTAEAEARVFQGSLNAAAESVVLACRARMLSSSDLDSLASQFGLSAKQR